jgi:MinD superfamily P-loop ATPase
MKELVVISGKGGTGKTSIVSSFAALASNAVLADCDVDAADLHLILKPRIVTQKDFSGGSQARIDGTACIGCGKCDELCRFGAITVPQPGANGVFSVDAIACEGCGVCAHFCPAEAIKMVPVVNGQWFISDTRFGPMVHAQLGVAEENSGKLVGLIRKEAKQIAETQGRQLLIIDGSPGTGCPVIASITGADLVLVVTEPTLSGLHDLQRVADLAKHFGIKLQVCVNKWDINPDLAAQIETQAAARGIQVVGRVRYDRAVTEAQIHEKSVIEYSDGEISKEIKQLWKNVYHAVMGISLP